VLVLGKQRNRMVIALQESRRRVLPTPSVPPATHADRELYTGMLAWIPREYVPSLTSGPFDCKKSALAMLSPPFVSSRFVEEWRTTDKARDVDRLIAG
jgi:hypothetical protein